MGVLVEWEQNRVSCTPQFSSVENQQGKKNFQLGRKAGKKRVRGGLVPIAIGQVDQKPVDALRKSSSEAKRGKCTRRENKGTFEDGR